MQEIGTKDVYIMSYTSGTTGDAKGVKLTSRMLLTVVDTVLTRLRITNGSRCISYLPLPHSFEQCMMGMALQTGCKIGYYQGNPAKLVEDCGLLQPTVFPSVPRLYNRIYGQIKAKFDAATGCKAWLAGKALASKSAALEANATYTSGCYDFLVFNKVKALLGGKVEYMVTGSAPIDLAVLNFLKVAFSCPIMEGYGLTETCGASSITASEDPVAGHVGGPIECVKFRLRDVPEMNYLSTDKPYPRGEVQMMGTNVTKGYYKRPDKTAEAFDEEGWFCSGDVATVYPNGSVKIIDRAKNIFKLSQGEYIAPEKLENVYVLCPLVAQICIYGDSLRNNVVCIICVEEPDV
jgi:long-chain acyl-CoA synthetase